VTVCGNGSRHTTSPCRLHTSRFRLTLTSLPPVSMGAREAGPGREVSLSLTFVCRRLKNLQTIQEYLSILIITKFNVIAKFKEKVTF